MIYKHEFLIDEASNSEDIERLLVYKKKKFSAELGERIAGDFGWEQVDSSEIPRWRIEIVAHPINKWRLFIDNLNDLLEPWQIKKLQTFLQNLDSLPKSKPLTNEQ